MVYFVFRLSPRKPCMEHLILIQENGLMDCLHTYWESKLAFLRKKSTEFVRDVVSYKPWKWWKMEENLFLVFQTWKWKWSWQLECVKFFSEIRAAFVMIVYLSKRARKKVVWNILCARTYRDHLKSYHIPNLTLKWYKDSVLFHNLRLF